MVFFHNDNIRTNTEVIPQDGGIDSRDSDSQLVTHCLSIRLKYPTSSLREADVENGRNSIHFPEKSTPIGCLIPTDQP